MHGDYATQKTELTGADNKDLNPNDRPIIVKHAAWRHKMILKRKQGTYYTIYMTPLLRSYYMEVQQVEVSQ